MGSSSVRSQFRFIIVCFNSGISDEKAENILKDIQEISLLIIIFQYGFGFFFDDVEPQDLVINIIFLIFRTLRLVRHIQINNH